MDGMLIAAMDNACARKNWFNSNLRLTENHLPACCNVRFGFLHAQSHLQEAGF